MPAFIDLTGQRFGRLTVLARGEDYVAPSSGRKAPRWVCRCDCGEEWAVMGVCLRGGTTRSCGCLQREIAAELLAKRAKKVVGYYGAHHRVRRVRGKASAFPCAGCGGPACDWSYDGGDPDERAQWVARRGSRALMAYSLDPSRYSPRCRDCHRAYDRAAP